MLADARLVASLIKTNGGRFVAITGAGCSTESGIPDYRSPKTGLYSRRPNFQPLTIQKFMRNDFEKKRYWGRSIFGYRGLSHKDCNKSHMGLHEFCKREMVPLLITQNVDGLHHLARHGGVWRGNHEELFKSPNGFITGADTCEDFGGSQHNGDLCELHGNIHVVKCMSCGATSSREEAQHKLEKLNTSLLETVAIDKGNMRPDADYELNDEVVDRVQLLTCDACGGHLRPDVVLFGESVPTPVVDKCFAAVDDWPVLICFGTSLHVYSSFRFVKRAAESGKGQTVIIVNRGPTRGDSLAHCRIETDSVGEFIHALQEELL